MNRALTLLAALLVVTPAPAADREAGRLKAAACAVCHGAQGLSVLPNAPHLAGQPQIYLAEQLHNYRVGRRVHEVMSVVAQALTEADIADLAEWYSSFTIEVREPR